MKYRFTYLFAYEKLKEEKKSVSTVNVLFVHTVFNTDCSLYHFSTVFRSSSKCNISVSNIFPIVENSFSIYDVRWYVQQTYVSTYTHQIHAPNHNIIKPHIKCSPPPLSLSCSPYHSKKISRSLSPFHCLQCHMYKAHINREKESRWSKKKTHLDHSGYVMVCNGKEIETTKTKAKKKHTHTYPRREKCKEKKMTYHI